ncbi:MAG: T9SS type A sorting domain-containing protein, partial [bacterium]
IGDVALTHILAPGTTVPVGAPFTPRARLALVSGPATTVAARMEIRKAGDLVYSGVSSPVLLGTGGVDTVDLSPPCTLAVIGTDYTAAAWHTSSPDRDPSNDSAAVSFVVGNVDMAMLAITAPTAQTLLNTSVSPQVRLVNLGDFPATAMVTFQIDDLSDGIVYDETMSSGPIDPGATAVVTFATPWNAAPDGNYQARAWHVLEFDTDPANDSAALDFVVIIRPPWDEGWVEVAPMPLAPSGKPARRGAWLVFNDGDGMLYATKGYKTQDFYRYNPVANTWVDLLPVPNDPVKGRPLEKGARGAADGDNTIYMVHGNNTVAFWKYDIAANEWTGLADVPLGPSGKRVKGGGDLVHVTVADSAYLYFLKGDRTEFFRYGIEGGQWQQMADAPVGIRNRFKRDGWLAWDGGNALYAHKPNYFDRGLLTHEFWRYDIAGDSWCQNPETRLAGMPLFGLHGGRIKRKKAKDGGAGALDGGLIYALKGGNTQQFWRYDIAADSWAELDTVPTLGSTGRRRRVNAGADLAGYGGGVFFALKGNKTAEMWRYVVPMGYAARPRPERGGVMAGELPAGVPFVKLGPNPVTSGLATLRYSLPKAGPASIHVYDVSGRNVLSRGVAASRSGAVSLDLRNLSAGIYLVKLEADGYEVTRKLVVQQ